MRLHCAAHLEFVKTEDGITTFRAVEGDVLSLVVNLGPWFGHQGSFVEVARHFACGEGCTPPERCSVELAAKVADWPEIMKGQLKKAEAAAAARVDTEAGKEARAVARAARKVPP